MAEIDVVAGGQLHVRHGDVHALDLAGRLPELDPGHVRDGRLFDPTRVGRALAYVHRRPAMRAGDPRTVARNVAKRTGIRRRGVAHQSVWWCTYMDWMPRRPGPVMRARNRPWRPNMLVFSFCCSTAMVTVESL